MGINPNASGFYQLLMDYVFSILCAPAYIHTLAEPPMLFTHFSLLSFELLGPNSYLQWKMMTESPQECFTSLNPDPSFPP